MLETASYPVAATPNKTDCKVEKGQLNLSVASVSPAIAKLPSSRVVVESDPESESAENTEKEEEPVGPLPPPLLILDLNGCILYREYVPGSPRIIKPRPYVDELFEYVSSNHPKNDKAPNWELMIWSSAMSRNVDTMLAAMKITIRPRLVATKPTRRGLSFANNRLNDISNYLDSLKIDQSTTESEEMTKKSVQRTVLDVWNRDTLDLPPEDYGRKVQTTKDLRKVWNQFSWTDPNTGDKLNWGAHNTVIVDDTPDKLSLQPNNLCLVEEFKGDPEDKGILDLIDTLKSIRDKPNIAEALKKLREKKTTS